MAENQRYFIELCYNGGNYHGWQVQPNAISVQQLLNQALSVILRQPVETTGCGRTDTGVHATQFFAHADIVSKTGIDRVKVLNSLNALLPHDIAVKRLLPVHAAAHARFDALQRSYQYHIHFNKDPFKEGFSCLLRDKPDIGLMNKAADIITTYTDFSCFSKSNTQVKTNNCKISAAYWRMENDSLTFHITADRFLRNMVRAIVGTLLMVGRGELTPADVAGIIESKDRSSAGESVPACGLYLTAITYPFLLTDEGNL